MYFLSIRNGNTVRSQILWLFIYHQHQEWIQLKTFGIINRSWVEMRVIVPQFLVLKSTSFDIVFYISNRVIGNITRWHNILWIVGVHCGIKACDPTSVRSFYQLIIIKQLSRWTLTYLISDYSPSSMITIKTSHTSHEWVWS